MLHTFFNDAPPPLGPVTQLNSVAFLYFRSLLEAADELVTQTVAVINPLHRPSVVPWLRNTHKTKLKRKQSFKTFSAFQPFLNLTEANIEL